MRYLTLWRNLFVLDTIVKANPKYTTPYFFLDAKRAEGGGSWIWEHTKQNVAKPNWGEGQPRNYMGVQDCIIIQTNDKKWETSSCKVILKAICQYP